MTQADQQKWDLRYTSHLGELKPSACVKKYYSLASRGRALDIACGNGRNSIFLESCGFHVDAIDVSPVATDHLIKNYPEINVTCQDLDIWKVPENQYQIILNIRFLDSGLLPRIIKGLLPGGLLIFESFMGEKNNKYCLKPNELLHAFSSFRIVYYEETKIDNPDRFDHIVNLVAIKAK